MRTSLLGYALTGQAVLGTGMAQAVSTGVTANPATVSLSYTPRSAAVFAVQEAIAAANRGTVTVTPWPAQASIPSVTAVSLQQITATPQFSVAGGGAGASAGTSELMWMLLPASASTGTEFRANTISLLYTPLAVHLPPARGPWFPVRREVRYFTADAESRYFRVRREKREIAVYAEKRLWAVKKSQ